jgi:tetratricopeptide (TPR) repeat protein
MTVIRRTLMTFLGVLLIFRWGPVCFAQVEDAKQAIDNGEFVRAVQILSDALATNPTADTYFYLGIAYGNMKEYQKAEDVLNEGSRRFPEEARFHDELAGVFLATREPENAKAELRRALEVDPDDSYASDLLASIDISEGEVQTALRFWNKNGRPVIDRILHNYYQNFGSWVVRDAVTFKPGDVLHYGDWKTTEARLFQTNIFANVGLEVEPTVVPDRYNAIVRTTAKTNLKSDVFWNLVKGAVYNTSYFNLWNLGNSGINWNSTYRWSTDRHLFASNLSIPLPVPGILQTESTELWRSERWNLSRIVRPQYVEQAQRVDYRANALLFAMNHIPNYRFEIGAVFKYANRYAKGDFPQVAANSENDGQALVATTFRFADGTYQNRLQLQAFGSSSSILGNFNYSGGTAEFDNRITLSKDTRTYFDWALKGGTSRGTRPLEDYFMLGLDIHPQNLLRGHALARHGQYGNGPMGTDFVLGNFDLERRIVTIPMFNTFNLPYIVIKWEGFVDLAKSWDRTDVFQNTKLLVDTGAGLRFDTPTTSFVIVYGRSLRDGQSVLTGYFEPRLW